MVGLDPTMTGWSDQEKTDVPHPVQKCPRLENARVWDGTGAASYPTDIGDTPPEEHTLIAARNAIDAGDLPGPRLKACGPEITVTGGLGDERKAHQFHDSFVMALIALFVGRACLLRKTPVLRVRTGPNPSVALCLCGKIFFD